MTVWLLSGSTIVVDELVLDTVREYVHVPAGWLLPGVTVRVSPAVLPSAQTMPLLPPEYEYVIVPPVGKVTEAIRPVTLFGYPGVCS